MLILTKKNGIAKIESIDMPRVDAGKTLVTVDYCGICGSDLQLYRSFDDVVFWGHEILGRVIKDSSEPTAPITIRTSFACNTCEKCIEGKYNQCVNWRRTSINGFSEIIAVDKKNIVDINTPNCDLSYVLTEPLYVAINLVNQIIPQANDNIAIVGNGTIGLLAAFYLRDVGCNNVTLFARNFSGNRGMFAELLGVKTILYPSIVNELKKYNKIIDTAPYETVNDIIENAGDHSCITFNGINSKNRILINMQSWHFKNLSINPSFPHPQTDFLLPIELIKKHNNILKNAITHIVNIQEAPKILEQMKNGELDCIKVVVKLH